MNVTKYNYYKTNAFPSLFVEINSKYACKNNIRV